MTVLTTASLILCLATVAITGVEALRDLRDRLVRGQAKSA